MLSCFGRWGFQADEERERERRERETGRGQLEGYLIAPPSTWRQTSAEPFDFVYKLQVR